MAASGGMSSDIPDVINVGLMGLGVVGTGVATHLLDRGSSLADVAGRSVNLKKVLVRDPALPRGIKLPSGVMTTNAEDILSDPEIHIVVEVMGGTDPAEGYLRQGLAAGKHVVTANKEVMAKSGPELLALARQNDASLLFEASVGGGIPIVGCLMNELAANDIRSIRSIINGTTNYILTRMAHDHAEFQQALEEAQQHGYAEADPTNDVDGIDAMYKLCILASLAFHRRVAPQDVFCQGITMLQPQDFRYADELGYAIKSLAIATQDNGRIQARVYPALLPKDHMLAKVDGVYNAVEVNGDLCGQVLFYGRGAGREPTTSAVVGDLLEIIRRIVQNGPPLQALEMDPAPVIQSIDDLESRYYLRLNVADQSGVLGQIARILGEEDISLAAVLQKDTNLEAQTAEIVITTHAAREASVQRSLQRVSELSVVGEISSLLRIEE